ncbi:PilN domain-containing protein [Shewanella algae]|uniref:PilN domain-containing protein n=1 Tax=Shewanella algae TaxID=38313 RepID=UPI001AAE0789|nr:PilN domain-containing protein [Shewanella algae]MBO2562654.1 PilN domain-containing protein [Shewanella algae]
MSKTRINLYSSSLLPPRLRLSFVRLLVIAGVFLLLGLSLIGLGWWQQTQVSRQLLEVESQRQALESQKQQLEAELAKRQPSAELVIELERRTQERELKGLLLTELGQRERMTSKGFAPVLQELAQVSDGSVWLSRIKLEEDKLEFEGFGQYPQSLPRWIDRLKQTESLRGRSFASMTMAREPGQPLAFVLTSEAREVKQ